MVVVRGGRVARHAGLLVAYSITTLIAAACASSGRSTPGTSAPEQLDNTSWSDSVLRTMTLREKPGSPGDGVVTAGEGCDDGNAVNAASSASSGRNGLADLSSRSVRRWTSRRKRTHRSAPRRSRFCSALTSRLVRAFECAADISSRTRSISAVRLCSLCRWRSGFARHDTAYEVGRVTAIEGRALGIHVAFDSARCEQQPGQSVIGARSFSENPHLTARLGVSLRRGLQDNGMLATVSIFQVTAIRNQPHLELSTVTPIVRDSIRWSSYRFARLSLPGSVPS